MIRQIWIAGAPGLTKRMLTRQAQAVLKHADTLIADEAVLKAADVLGVPASCKRFTLKMDALQNILSENCMYNTVILLPLDPADDERLDEILKITAPMKPALIPGVSVRSILSARTGVGLAGVTSVHLTESTNLVQLLLQHEKLIVSGGSIEYFSDELKAAGLSRTELYILNHPGSDEEQLLRGTLAQLPAFSVSEDALILLIPSKRKKSASYAERMDRVFEEGELQLPKELRAVLVDLLRPGRQECVYVIGSGGGDAAAYAAREASDGKVYAFEKSERAAALSDDAFRKLGIRNLILVGGEAPRSLGHLEAPDAALVIGCAGIHHALLQILLSRNPEVRIVICTSTMETAVRDLELLAARGLEASLRQISIHEAAGGRASHRLKAGAPCYVITARAEDRG